MEGTIEITRLHSGAAARRRRNVVSRRLVVASDDRGKTIVPLTWPYRRCLFEKFVSIVSKLPAEGRHSGRPVKIHYDPKNGLNTVCSDPATIDRLHHSCAHGKRKRERIDYSQMDANIKSRLMDAKKHIDHLEATTSVEDQVGDFITSRFMILRNGGTTRACVADVMADADLPADTDTIVDADTDIGGNNPRNQQIVFGQSQSQNQNANKRGRVENKNESESESQIGGSKTLNVKIELHQVMVDTN